jgi:hypothetical protein
VVVGSNPRWEDHFSGTIYLDQNPGAKINNGMFQSTWHCCMCCNPINGRLDFNDSRLIKIQLHNWEWTWSLSADQDQSATKKWLSQDSKAINTSKIEALGSPIHLLACFGQKFIDRFLKVQPRPSNLADTKNSKMLILKGFLMKLWDELKHGWYFNFLQ